MNCSILINISTVYVHLLYSLRVQDNYITRKTKITSSEHCIKRVTTKFVILTRWLRELLSREERGVLMSCVEVSRSEMHWSSTSSSVMLMSPCNIRLKG